MEKIIHLLDDLIAKKIISDYAIGGATALLYYSTPTFTEDIDIFIAFERETDQEIISLEPIFNFLRLHHQATLEAQYIIVYGFPLQFLPVYNELSKAALQSAEQVSLNDISARIFSLEYLMALMIQLGKDKYMERLRLLLLEKKFDAVRLDHILKKHKLEERWQTIRNRITLH